MHVVSLMNFVIIENIILIPCTIYLGLIQINCEKLVRNKLSHSRKQAGIPRQGLSLPENVASAELAMSFESDCLRVIT